MRFNRILKEKQNHKSKQILEPEMYFKCVCTSLNVQSNVSPRRACLC